MIFKKYDIVIVNLNTTKGAEQQGRRPCVVLQNNIANASRIKTIVIAPTTTNIKNTPTGIIFKKNSINNLDINSRLELSQIRVIDKSRIINKIGEVDNVYHKKIKQKLSLFLDLDDQF